MAHTIDDIFSALMSGEEPTKTAGENGTDVVVPQTTEAQKEAAAVIARGLSDTELDSLRSFVKEAGEVEKDAETQKLAEEAFATGQFMARGFANEMEHIAAENNGEATYSDSAVTNGAANVPTPAASTIVSDGSTALNFAKKEDAVSSPKSPTVSQDVMKVVKSVISAAAVATKGQDQQEIPNNLGV